MAAARRHAAPAGLRLLALALALVAVAAGGAISASAAAPPHQQPEHQQQQQQELLRVPKLLHRSFMAGEAALRQAARDPNSGFKAHWLDSCRTHNPGWREVVWDAAAVEALVRERYPWFLQTYLSYSQLVQRSDVARYMVLHAHGGVYLDADVECFAPMERSLLGRDLVLNCEYAGAQGQLHNAAMAAAPGHPFWLAVLREAMARAGVAPPPLSALPEAGGSGGGSAGPRAAAQWRWQPVVARGRGALAALWRASPFHNRVNAVLHSTGPMLLTSVYRRHVAQARGTSSSGGSGSWGRASAGAANAAGEGAGATCGVTVRDAGGRVAHAYALGEWFTPCFFTDGACQRRWAARHALLTNGGGGDSASSSSGGDVDAEATAAAAAAATAVVGIHHYSASWTDWDTATARAAGAVAEAAEAGRAALEFWAASPGFLRHACGAALPPGADEAAALLAGNSSSSSSGSSSGSSSSSVSGGVMPLCAEQVRAALQGGSCSMVSVLAPQQQRRHGSSSSGSSQEWAADVATEQLLARLGCHVTTLSPEREPPQPLRALRSVAAAPPPQQPPPAAPAAALQHLQGQLRAVARYDEEPPAVPLQSLLRLDPRDAAAFASSGGAAAATRSLLLLQEQQQGQAEEHEQQQQQQQPRPPLQQILRLSCAGCERAVLRHLFDAGGEAAAALGRVSALLVDVAVPDDGDEAALADLGSAHRLLYQQQGFVGFMRRRLPDGRLRLGWVRRGGGGRGGCSGGAAGGAPAALALPGGIGGSGGVAAAGGAALARDPAAAAAAAAAA